MAKTTPFRRLVFSKHAIMRFLQWSDVKLTRAEAVKRMARIVASAVPAKAHRLEDGKIRLLPPELLVSGEWAIVHKEGMMLTIYRKTEDIL